MIRNKTTLILGAGASQCFDYPTGEELFQKILALTKQGSIEYEILNYLTNGPREIDEFRNSLNKSGRYSIDEFLENNSKYNLIGKCAIALALIPKENEEKLFEGNSGNWYKYLFRIMCEDCTIDNFLNNNISFITFNYDRSLEQYFFTALKNNYGESDDTKCCEIIQKLRIVHLHGKLGLLPYENVNVQKEFSSVYYNPKFRMEERINITGHTMRKSIIELSKTVLEI